MWLIYQVLFGLLLLLAGPILLLTRGGHYRPTVAHRLGFRYPRKAPKGALWIHAVSVGEVAVAEALVRNLDPSLPLLVTTITPTGQARAQKVFGDRAQVAYLPFDLGFAVARFFRAFEPRALILVEGDYWPLLLRRTRDLGLPVAVINGRVGDRSFGRLMKVRPLISALFGAVERFGVQSAQDLERLQRLGIEDHRLSVTGNLKFEAPEPPLHSDLEASVTAMAAGRPVLLAGSTMVGEESLVVEAWRQAGGGESSLLILAPRHPERWGEVASLLERMKLLFGRRSEVATGERVDVFLLDSLGELAGLYRSATAAFIGGTLVPTGGHNPLEPARFGVPVLVGPSMSNFRDMAALFEANEAWEQVDDVNAMAQSLRRWFDEPEMAQEVGRRGLELVKSNRGAVEKTLKWIQPQLEIWNG